jgi:hypothetical protein
MANLYTIKEILNMEFTGLPMSSPVKDTFQQEIIEEIDPPKPVPRVCVKDGSIVVDKSSLVVDYTPKMTRQSVRKKNTYTRPWTVKEKKLLKSLVKVYGSDFSVIEQEFKNNDIEDRTRRQILNEWKRLEKF